jgi:hypothetical protein
VQSAWRSSSKILTPCPSWLHWWSIWSWNWPYCVKGCGTLKNKLAHHGHANRRHGVGWRTSVRMVRFLVRRLNFGLNATGKHLALFLSSSLLLPQALAYVEAQTSRRHAATSQCWTAQNWNFGLANAAGSLSLSTTACQTIQKRSELLEPSAVVDGKNLVDRVCQGDRSLPSQIQTALGKSRRRSYSFFTAW